MSPSVAERPSAPAWPAQAHWAIRLVCTSNPFYVISALLFLAGLWLSCDPEQMQDTWGLMFGLAGYTLLLALTAFLLIRVGKIWDDARTVLLLVVMMFLATSVTFDRALIFTPWQGILCNVLGLVLAIVVSEALLRGTGLRLPIGFRLPYYLILALYFLYPAGLALFLDLKLAPRSEPVMWGMFGFATAAALVFATLIFAVRRGGEYVEETGTPWTWPLYPWALFGMLGLLVPARAILMSYTLYLIDVRDLYEVTFGFYFLVPFGIVVATLVLEAGIASERAWMKYLALGMPVLLLILAFVGHRDERIYVEFLEIFQRRLGAGLAYCTLTAVVLFYAYAAIRQAPIAVEALTIALTALACLRPATIELGWDALTMPHPTPLMAAGTLMLGIGVWRQASWRCFLGTMVLTLAVLLAFPDAGEAASLRWPVVLHLAILSLLVVGGSFEDYLCHLLRFGGGLLATLVCLGVMYLPISPPEPIPAWLTVVYPIAMVLLLAGYGVWLWNRPILVMAGGILACWLLASGWQLYRQIRQIAAGIDYLAISLIVFMAAIGVSLLKTRLFANWLRSRSVQPVDTPSDLP